MPNRMCAGGPANWQTGWDVLFAVAGTSSSFPFPSRRINCPVWSYGILSCHDCLSKLRKLCDSQDLIPLVRKWGI